MSMNTRGRGGAKNYWYCKDCSKKFTKLNDQLMECEYCENHFCSVCLNMTDTEYEHHIHSSGMWFCRDCKPKVEETLKIEKEIEKRCQEHFEKYSKKIEQIEKTLHSKMGTEVIDQKLSNFLEKGEIVQLIEEKLKDKTGHGETQTSQTDLIELVNKQVEAKSMAEIVKQQFSNSVNEQDMLKLIGDKVEESEKDMAERQNRERNIVIFKLPEPNTNLTTERKTKDLEDINKMIEFMYAENEHDVVVEKIIRLGARHKEYQQNPRPVLVTFTNFQAKKSFLRNSKLLKDSNDEVHKQVAIANDMTKRDREKELELVNQRREKNLAVVGPWKYVIRGPPGDRKIVKIRKQ